MGEQLLLDTVYVQALLNRNDQHYEKAVQLLPRVRAASRVFITEAVLLEIGNCLSSIDHRKSAVKFIDGCYEKAERNLQVIAVDTELIRRALKLFDDRPDKTWTVTDCISFLVMDDNHIENAVTADAHFIQANFRALMLEE